jgi:hypothetical protein
MMQANPPSVNSEIATVRIQLTSILIPIDFIENPPFFCGAAQVQSGSYGAAHHTASRTFEHL